MKLQKVFVSQISYGSAGPPPSLTATLGFKVELVNCRPKKGSNIVSVSDGRTCLGSRLWSKLCLL
ncbi:hypothetical protein MKW94_014602 [Papaver nudicaule]|uniref:Uncharacterized protein n=1 Tax=Papaver nudicaule TaxID=74823 RepID=A0AA41VKV6_PAPNU|nr:hypothetical protein [Papaver nudicaule]